MKIIPPFCCYRVSTIIIVSTVLLFSFSYKASAQNGLYWMGGFDFGWLGGNNLHEGNGTLKSGNSYDNQLGLSSSNGISLTSSLQYHFHTNFAIETGMRASVAWRDFRDTKFQGTYGSGKSINGFGNFSLDRTYYSPYLGGYRVC